MDKKDVDRIFRIFRRLYPDSRVALDYGNPLQLLVATILSAQCTDKKVNEITKPLFIKYPGVNDFAGASVEELQEAVRPTGFYRNKARNIINSARMIRDEFGGEVPDSMDKLLRLPGVARKTANIVLSSAFKRAEGIAVDTHVKRLSERLGMSGHHDPDKIERDLLNLIPKQDWLDANYLLVNHGRSICKARKPQCEACQVRLYCAYFKSRS